VGLTGTGPLRHPGRDHLGHVGVLAGRPVSLLVLVVVMQATRHGEHAVTYRGAVVLACTRT